MTEFSFAYFSSPIGLIEINGANETITGLRFIDQQPAAWPSAKPAGAVGEAIRQLEEYFAGSRQGFDLPLALQGTEFQLRVWQHLLTIPFGQTLTYQEIADALGNPQAVRAVGAANGQNPIAILVPCHRVIGANGKLVGYGGGLWRKEWLLRHEGALLL